MSMADVWQTTPVVPTIPLAESLRLAASRSGRGLGQLIRELASLTRAPGRLQPQDYFYYRLFEPGFDAATQRRFVGKRLEARLHDLTCDKDWWIVAHDKLVCYAVLQAAGLPVPRTRALYRDGAAFGTGQGLQSLPDRAALAAALRGGITYPLFGKPVRGIRSVGVLSIDGYDGATDQLQLAQGDAVAVDEVLDAVGVYAKDGYLLQERIAQHPAIEGLCGAAIATVRLIVLLTPAGRVIHRALWKLPAGNNVADNFWRDGNLLAALDPSSGRITRVVEGVGAHARAVDRHPTSGAPLLDVQLPGWAEIRDLVDRAATALPGVRMQAWDVALGVDGPLLVEVNIGGDYNLPQLATGTGMLDAPFRAFLDHCARERGLERQLAKLKLGTA